MINLLLFIQVFIAPVAATVITMDINFGEVNLDADLVISSKIDTNRRSMIRKVDVHVKLEANTVDWATSFLHILYHVENDIASPTVPTIHCGVTVVIVEQLSIRVSFVCPFERLADEVVDTGPWSVRSDSIRFCIIDGFVDNIPGYGLTFVPSDSGVDVIFHEFFNLLGILLPLNEVRHEWLFSPDGCMSSESHVIVFGKFSHIVTLGVVEIGQRLGNSLHLTAGLSSDQVVFLHSCVVIPLISSLFIV
jgi:hypothetical protein